MKTRTERDIALDAAREHGFYHEPFEGGETKLTPTEVKREELKSALDDILEKAGSDLISIFQTIRDLPAKILTLHHQTAELTIDEMADPRQTSAQDKLRSARRIASTMFSAENFLGSRAVNHLSPILREKGVTIDHGKIFFGGEYGGVSGDDSFVGRCYRYIDLVGTALARVSPPGGFERPYQDLKLEVGNDVDRVKSYFDEISSRKTEKGKYLGMDLLGNNAASDASRFVLDVSALVALLESSASVLEEEGQRHVQRIVKEAKEFLDPRTYPRWTGGEWKVEKDRSAPHYRGSYVFKFAFLLHALRGYIAAFGSWREGPEFYLSPEHLYPSMSHELHRAIRWRDQSLTSPSFRVSLGSEKRGYPILANRQPDYLKILSRTMGAWKDYTAYVLTMETLLKRRSRRTLSETWHIERRREILASPHLLLSSPQLHFFADDPAGFKTGASSDVLSLPVAAHYNLTKTWQSLVEVWRSSIVHDSARAIWSQSAAARLSAVRFFKVNGEWAIDLWGTERRRTGLYTPFTVSDGEEKTFNIGSDTYHLLFMLAWQKGALSEEEIYERVRTWWLDELRRYVSFVHDPAAVRARAIESFKAFVGEDLGKLLKTAG